MRKDELVKALAEYPDDTEVFITLPGAKQIFFIDKITRHSDKSPVLETDEAPDFDDLEGMADSCWDDNYRILSESQRDAIMVFSEKAANSVSRWKE